MLYSVERLLEQMERPLCVVRGTPVIEALRLMVEHDYSQLPVVDEEGDLVGIVSEQSFTRTYFHLNDQVSMLNLAVEYFQVEACTLTPDRTLFDVIDRLKKEYAVVITEDRKPVGIVTNYDIAHFFRDISEGLILIEDIEVTLRGFIKHAFPKSRALLAALMKAFGADRRESSRPAREYDRMTFIDHVQLITAEENWLKFEQVLGPKEYFRQMMQQVGDIRNQTVHFRGRPNAVQLDALKKASHWLEHRPRLSKLAEGGPHITAVPLDPSRLRKTSGRYGPLQDYLSLLDGDMEVLSFEDIEENILNENLPPSARSHRSWWANDSDSYPQSRSWLQAGWMVEDVDLAGEMVLLVRRETDL